MSLSRHQLYGYGRPVSVPYSLISIGSASFEYGRAGFSEKADGWKLIVAVNDCLQNLPFSNAGHMFPGNSCATMNAIGQHFNKHFGEIVCPFRCRMYNRFRAVALHAEFVAMKRYPSGEIGSCLEDLLSGACLTNGKLNTEDYTYEVKIFDAIFTTAKGLKRCEWYERIEAVINTFGQKYAVNVIRTAAEFRNALLFGEGVVGHELCSFGADEPLPRIIKIKMPKIPTAVSIVGVECTLPDSDIWSKIYLGVNGATPDVKHIVVVYDYSDMLTYGSKSKVHVNPRSIKKGADQVVVCTSASVMGPILNALYGEISKSKLYFANGVKPLSATLRNGVQAVCGSARKCKLNSKIQFLDPMPKITIGANKCWLNSDGSVHMQAPALLSTSTYGMPQYQGLPFTSVEVLESIAVQQPSVHEVYTRVGMRAGPLDDMMPLSPSSFSP